MGIKIGHTGEAVFTLQNQLNKLGYRVSEDGVFGYTTLLAVRDFQRQVGLTVDGIVGTGTNAKILLMLGNIKVPKTEHFKMTDFISADDTTAVKNGVPYIYYCNLQTLMERLEKLQDTLEGSPLVIRSGYRSPAYNKRVGGAAQSQHLFAKAADIYVKDYAMSSFQLAQRLVSDESLVALFGGVGLGSVKNVHVDIRTAKDAQKPTIWWYGHKSWKAWERAK